MTTNGPAPMIVTSTADLEPDGVRGYTKAIWAGVAAGLTAAGTALADGIITPLEWVGIATAVVLTAGGTYGFAMKVKPVMVLPKTNAMTVNIPILGVVDPPGEHATDRVDP